MKQHIIKEKVIIEPNKMDYFTGNNMANAKRIERTYGRHFSWPLLKTSKKYIFHRIWGT